MDTFLTGLKSAVDTLGATVLLPIVIFIIAVVLGAKVGRHFVLPSPSAWPSSVSTWCSA